jgi:hypothetical protein
MAVTLTKLAIADRRDLRRWRDAQNKSLKKKHDISLASMRYAQLKDLSVTASGHFGARPIDRSAFRPWPTRTAAERIERLGRRTVWHRDRQVRCLLWSRKFASCDLLSVEVFE